MVIYVMVSIGIIPGEFKVPTFLSLVEFFYIENNPEHIPWKTYKCLYRTHSYKFNLTKDFPVKGSNYIYSMFLFIYPLKLNNVYLSENV